MYVSAFIYTPHGKLLGINLKHDVSFTDEYPFYVMESESCEMEDLEIMYVTSLMMLHCILESKNKSIMEHMCKLDDETQIYIKNFFETMMQYDNNITRNVVKHAVSECGKLFCYE
jgi:hypothetical protein